MDYGPLNLPGPAIVALFAVAVLLVISIICVCYFSNPFGLPGIALKIMMTIATIVTVVITAILTVTLWTECTWRANLVTVRNVAGIAVMWATASLATYRVHREFYSSW